MSSPNPFPRPLTDDAERAWEDRWICGDGVESRRVDSDALDEDVHGFEPALVPDVAPGWRWWVHNLVAHPLLVLCPPAGEWLHDRTEP